MKILGHTFTMADEENEEKNLNCIKNYGGMSTEKSSNDPIADIIGDVGKWQIWRILLLFCISIPGLAMIFSVPFVFNKVDYWCDKNLSYTTPNSEYIDLEQLKNDTFKNKCTENCNKYIFDTTEWSNTVIMEWEMVCDRSYLEGRDNSQMDIENYDISVFL